MGDGRLALGVEVDGPRLREVRLDLGLDLGELLPPLGFLVLEERPGPRRRRPHHLPAPLLVDLGVRVGDPGRLPRVLAPGLDPDHVDLAAHRGERDLAPEPAHPALELGVRRPLERVPPDELARHALGEEVGLAEELDLVRQAPDGLDRREHGGRGGPRPGRRVDEDDGLRPVDGGLEGREQRGHGQGRHYRGDDERPPVPEHGEDGSDVEPFGGSVGRRGGLGHGGRGL